MPFVLFLWCFMMIAGLGGAPVEAGQQTHADHMQSVPGQTEESDIHDVSFGQNYLMPQSEQLLPRNKTEAADWSFWLFSACFFSLALSRFLFAERLQQFVRAIFVHRDFNQLDREGSVLREFPSLLLLFNYLAIFALMIFLGVQYLNSFQTDLSWHPALLTLAIFAGILVFFLLKRIAVGFFSWVFGTRQASQLYAKNTLLFNKFSGMVLLPLVALSLFMPSETALWLAWGLWLLLHLFRVMRGAVIAHASAGFSVYYLILYLCGVELAPALLVIKVAHNLLAA